MTTDLRAARGGHVRPIQPKEFWLPGRRAVAETDGMLPRAILVLPELMERMVTRDADCNRLRVDWGERGADGFYSPTITVDATDNPLDALRASLDPERPEAVEAWAAAISETMEEGIDYPDPYGDPTYDFTKWAAALLRARAEAAE